MWTVPACEGVEFSFGEMVGCSHMSGPLVRYCRSLALMEFADRVPYQEYALLCALNYSGLPDPRLDRSPSRPLHPRMLNGLAAPMPGCPKNSFAQAGTPSPRIITAQMIRAVLLASATAARFGRFTRQQSADPLAVAGRPVTRMAQHGNRTGGEQAADVFVAALAGPPQAFLAAARILPRCHSQPGGELPARTKQRRIGNRGRDGAGAHDADPRDGRQQPTDPALPMPSGHAHLDLPDPGHCAVQSSAGSSAPAPAAALVDGQLSSSGSRHAADPAVQ